MAITNDTCALGTGIGALPFEDFVDTTSATEDGSDPTPASPGTALYNTVWFSWVADRNTPVCADVAWCDVASAVAVFTGACGSLTEVASGTKTAVWTPSIGTTYRIMVGSVADGGGASTQLQLYDATYSSKFYLTDAGSTQTVWSPSGFQGTWDVTTALNALYGTPSKAGNNAGQSATRPETSSSAAKVACMRVLIGPLVKQSISGNLNCVLEVNESAADADAYWAVHAYVSQGESNSVRGTLISNYTESLAGGATEWTTTATGTAFQSAIAMSTVNAEHGDYIVLEIGAKLYNTTSSSRSITIKYGSGSFSLALGQPPDLTLGEMPGGLRRAGYLTFSNAIYLYAPAPATDDVLASNRDLWLFDRATGAFKRRVFIDRVNQPAGGAQVGGNGNVYITDETGWQVLVYDTQLNFVTAYDTNANGGEIPHAAAFNVSDRLFIGNTGDGGADGCGEGIGVGSAASIAIGEFEADGTPVATHAITAQNGGSNAIDLSADGKTLYYTSIGSNIYALNLVTGLVSVFATVSGGSNVQTRGLRVLPDGGLLVAVVDNYLVPTSSIIQRFTRSGALAETYSVSGQKYWGTVTLTSDGAHCYCANTADTSFCAPMIAKFQVGNNAAPVYTITGTYVPDTGGYLCSGGILAWNGYRAALNPTLLPHAPSVLCCPCDCDDKPDPKTGTTTTKPLPSATGPILAAVDPLAWTPQCAGGGSVPAAADATDAENWVA